MVKNMRENMGENMVDIGGCILRGGVLLGVYVVGGVY